MTRIALVGCSKSKLDRAAPARELYTGQLFRAALAYAESQRFDGALVLSALHGTLGLEEVVEPYDQELRTLTRQAREDWGARVISHLGELCANFEGDTIAVEILAPALYAEPVLLAAAHRGCVKWPCTFTTPLAGLGIGQQGAWLREHTAQPRSVADLVLQLDRQYPGATDDDMKLPAADWQRLVQLARNESTEETP